MPIHQFIHEESGETIDEYVPASAPAEQHSRQIRDGKVFKRVYAAPMSAIDSRIEEGSKEEFARITNKKGIKTKDMWELSEEMSKRRAEKNGVDPVKQKFYREFEKEHGVKHTGELQEEKRRRAKLIAEQFGFET